MKIKGFLLCLCVVIVTCQASVITIATYNLWNVMFNWEVRKQYIATKLSQLDVDVAAFQEVRSHQRTSWSQLHELQQLLPSYKWLLYQPVQVVTPPKYGAPAGWEVEGMGLLSRLPITHHVLQSVVQDSRLDKNKRVVLHASISHSGGESFTVSVVHLSSDRSQQCSNVAQILSHLKDHTTACSVILGDFNTYNNFEWPVLALQEGKFLSTNKCYASRQHGYGTLEKVGSYVDVWKQAYPAKQGYTFSNMPNPGFESRPDRILLSRSCFSVVSSQLVGFGSEYKNMFGTEVVRSRYRSVFESAKASYYAYSGSLCYFDCGPHASCRCGICVDGGDTRDCLLPNCSECSATLFKQFVILAAFTVYLILNCCCIIFKFVRTLKTWNSDDFFNKLFFTGGKNMRRKWLVCICLPFHHLPILFAMILNVIILIGIHLLWQTILNETLTSVNAIIPEEFNPSDHLMVIGQLEIV